MSLSTQILSAKNIKKKPTKDYKTKDYFDGNNLTKEKGTVKL